jgi:hypothetical protein
MGEQVMMGGTSDKLKGEAGLVVRDALRAARHAVSLGRRRYRSVRERHTGSGPTAGVLEGVDRLAEGALDTAARVAHAAFELVARRERVRLPAPADVFLHPSPELRSDPKIIFAHAAYDFLRRSLHLLGAPKRWVMETRIEAALSRRLKKRRGGPGATRLLCASGLGAAAAPGDPASGTNRIARRDGERSESLIARNAVFALGSQLRPPHVQGLGEEEADAVLASPPAWLWRLDESSRQRPSHRTSNACSPPYAPHV